MKWGTYAYRKIPFGLINTGDTFKIYMYISFNGIISQILVIYLDNIIVYSKQIDDYPKQLKHIFEICRKYDVSLNPEKNKFVVLEGILLGNVISKDRISMDPERNKAIMQIPPPHNKNSMQSFFGKINFVRRFVLDFAEIVKPLQWMIKKYV